MVIRFDMGRDSVLELEVRFADPGRGIGAFFECGWTSKENAQDRVPGEQPAITIQSALDLIRRVAWAGRAGALEVTGQSYRASTLNNHETRPGRGFGVDLLWGVAGWVLMEELKPFMPLTPLRPFFVLA